MIVVADSSPFVVLTQIGHGDVLPALFGQVVAPPQVMQELRSSDRSPSVRLFAHAPPPWLIEQAPSSIRPRPGLHLGETAALCLAHELHADLLLIDERKGREVAVSEGLAIAGTIGVLERAAKQNLLDLADAFELVKQTDFWISHDLLAQRLALFRSGRS